MGIFDKLFKRKKHKTDIGPMPSRTMNFQYELIPENGVKFAEQFINAVKINEQIDLDYSEESLKYTDQFLQRFRDEGLTVNDFAETIFAVGCYVGQVMIINHQAKWVKQEDANLPSGIMMMPIVIQLANGTVTDPISKSFKRFYNGEEDNITFYYRVFTSYNR